MIFYISNAIICTLLSHTIILFRLFFEVGDIVVYDDFEHSGVVYKLNPSNPSNLWIRSKWGQGLWLNIY